VCSAALLDGEIDRTKGLKDPSGHFEGLDKEGRRGLEKRQQKWALSISANSTQAPFAHRRGERHCHNPPCPAGEIQGGEEKEKSPSQNTRGECIQTDV